MVYIILLIIIFSIGQIWFGPYVYTKFIPKDYFFRENYYLKEKKIKKLTQIITEVDKDNKILELEDIIGRLRSENRIFKDEIAMKIKKIAALDDKIATQDKYLTTLNRDYSKLYYDYKTLERDYQTNIKSVNNDLLFSCEQNISEVVTTNSDYLIWGSCIFFTVIACALGYYFLSNKINIVDQFSIFRRNNQQTLIENINNRGSSNSSNQNIVPEIDIPELTTNTINENSINVLDDLLVINEEAFNYVYDEAFTQFIYELIDDSLSQSFDLILENNQILQQLLLVNEPTTSMAVTSTITSLI